MSALDPFERERLIHDLEVHQAELESQNRQLREAQQLLEESRARLSDLYDFAPIAYYTFDRAGKIEELNLAGAALLGRERGRLIGKPFAAFVQAQDRARFQRHLDDCAAGQSPCKTELVLTRPPHTTMVVEIASAPWLGHGGRVDGCRSALTDITKRREAEDALRLAVRMRENFLAIVSHDLRNPLNAIVMASELLLRSTPPDESGERARAQLGVIRRAGERMGRLVADLLDLSSMDAGHLSMQRELHDVRELASAALDLVRPLALQKSLHLEEDAPTEAISCDCDRERILQVLLNTLGNAIKFTPLGGTVRLEVTLAGDTAVWAVRDTGVGIPDEQRRHIFDPYWKADRQHSLGTGLGLSIAKGIVELHGGRIWVESSEGSGTTVLFTIPAIRAARGDERRTKARSRPAPPEIRPRHCLPGATVLIVDDETDMRDSLAEILTGEGYRVITAANGREALELLHGDDDPPALILLDLVMPEMDGWSFLEERTRDPRVASVPVVLLSGQADGPRTAHQYHLAGYIEKPIGVANLFRALNEVELS